MNNPETYMERALQLADLAEQAGEVPVGAVILIWPRMLMATPTCMIIERLAICPAMLGVEETKA